MGYRYCNSMTNLIPQKRSDKNGRLVTRHVKIDASSAAGVASLPAPKVGATAAPSSAPAITDLSDAELFDDISRNLSAAGFALTYSHMELIEGTKALKGRRSLLEALHEETQGIDKKGAESLIGDFAVYRHTRHDSNSSCLELAARAYKFARKVDDATPVTGNPDDEFFYQNKIGLFAKQFFSSDITNGSDPDDATELEGAYLLERLDLNYPGKFNTEGSYYRTLHKLKDRRDELEDYLPLLIAARMVDHKSNTTVEDIFELAGKLAEVCPVEKVDAVTQVVMERRIFSIDLVQKLADSDATSLNSGVL